MGFMPVIAPMMGSMLGSAAATSIIAGATSAAVGSALGAAAGTFIGGGSGKESLMSGLTAGIGSYGFSKLGDAIGSSKFLESNMTNRILGGETLGKIGSVVGGAAGAYMAHRQIQNAKNAAAKQLENAADMTQQFQKQIKNIEVNSRKELIEALHRNKFQALGNIRSDQTAPHATEAHIRNLVTSNAVANKNAQFHASVKALKNLADVVARSVHKEWRMA